MGLHGRNVMKKNKKAISFGYPTCVFLILILTLGTSYGDVANILVNPGFETGTTGPPAAAMLESVQAHHHLLPILALTEDKR